MASWMNTTWNTRAENSCSERLNRPVKRVNWSHPPSRWTNVCTFGGVRKSVWASLLGALVEDRHDNHRKDRVPKDGRGPKPTLQLEAVLAHWRPKRGQMTEEQDAAARPERSLLSLTFSLHVEAISDVVVVAVVQSFSAVRKRVLLSLSEAVVVSVEPFPAFGTGQGDGVHPEVYPSCKQRPRSSAQLSPEKN